MEAYADRVNAETVVSQIDVAVNAPEAGTIKEFLANEEDTVTVGQDLVKMELGGAPLGGEKQEAGQQPKAPASDDQPTSSDPDPEPSKRDNRSEQERPSPTPPASSPQQKEPQQTKPESQQEVPKQEPPKQEGHKKPSPATKAPELKKSEGPFGNREERRVWAPALMFINQASMLIACSRSK